MNKQSTRGVAFWSLLVLTLVGCATPGGLLGETVGEKFKKALANLDARCKELKMGPYYDPSDPESRRRASGTDCDILKLEPRDWRDVKFMSIEAQPYLVPEHWLKTPEVRFAHTIKLPSPHNQKRTEYRPTMTGEAYFKALCEKEAGEFIFRTAEKVRRVRQDRPWIQTPNGYRGLVFWTREKGDLGDKPQDYLVQPTIGKFDALEIRISDTEPVRKEDMYKLFFRIPVSQSKRSYQTSKDGRFVTMPYIVDEKIIAKSEAQYAYTWRGILPEQGLQHGIEGYEVIVYRVMPLEVLGFQRVFFRHEPDTSVNDPRATFARACPENVGRPHAFIQKVLKPSNTD